VEPNNICRVHLKWVVPPFRQAWQLAETGCAFYHCVFSVVQRFSGVSQLAGGTGLLIGTCTCVPACTASNSSDGEHLTPWGVHFCSPWSKPFDTFGLQCPVHPVAPHGGSARRAHQQNEFIAETKQPHVQWCLRGCGALSQKNNVPDVRTASATFSCSSWLVFHLSFLSRGSLGRKGSRHPGIASS
jgi:hypothetical protein